MLSLVVAHGSRLYVLRSRNVSMEVLKLAILLLAIRFT
nr:MAG TPA_asm: hypothetical protein [Caudoviricetes sp.]